MKLIIDAVNYGKTTECQSKKELLEEIEKAVCQETVSVKVLIENENKTGKEAGRDHQSCFSQSATSLGSP